jgi:hypothetical protein
MKLKNSLASSVKATAEIKKFQLSLRPHKSKILSGTVLAIDPSSISLGWAWFQQGILIMNGEYKAPANQSANKRLVKLMTELQQWTGADVLVVEKMFRYNAPLIWSVGASVVTVKPEALIEMPIRVWQAYCSDEYVKSDAEDAKLIGETLIYLAGDLK